MPEVDLPITWHSEEQKRIFLSTARFNVLAAGRRYGKTKGAFHRLVRVALTKKCRQLWVDTTQANIEKYYAEHLQPLLPKEVYKWNKQQKVLTFTNGSVVHFGSVQKPENLEGFGYNYIWLNEAGIILKGDAGERLWQNTIRPMAMEGDPLPVVWFIGTPKGLGLFKEFADRGKSDEKKWKEWAYFHHTTHDRPGISDEEIDALIEETPGGRESRAVRQEILAQFLQDDEGDPIIPYERAFEALNREIERDTSFHRIWGVDPSGGGYDDAAICKRQGNTLISPTVTRSGVMDGEIGAAWILDEYENTPEEGRPRKIMIDSIGVGEGWYTHAKAKGLPVYAVNWSVKALNNERFALRRDELWYAGAEWCKTGSLAGDRNLFLEIVKPLIVVKWLEEKGKIKIEPKEDMKKRLKKDGGSPNRADAFILTFASGIERKTSNRPSVPLWRRAGSQGGVPWMSV